MIESTNYSNLRYFNFFRKCLNLLPRPERRKYIRLSALQAFLGLLDLIGVGLIGAIGALAIRGFQSRTPGDRVSYLLGLVHLSKSTLQMQVFILSLLALTFFVGKTILNIFLNKKILFFLSEIGSNLSTNLLMGIFGQKLMAIQKASSDKFQYSTGFGVWSISLGVLGVGANMFSDFILLIILLGALLYVDSLISISIFIFFLFLVFSLNFAMRHKSRNIGSDLANLQIQSTQQMNDLLITYRENYVRNSRLFFIDRLSATRAEYSKAFAEQTFLPNVSKYVVELSLILGGITIFAIQFALRDASRAVAGISLFLAVGSRIAPALLRLHQGYIQIQSSMGTAMPAYELIVANQHVPKLERNSKDIVDEYEDFIPKLELQDIHFKYPNSKNNLFENLNIVINPGEFIGVVGPSGAGKSTLVDIILGIFEPSKGIVKISETDPEKAVTRWPGAIAYIPQTVGFVNSTIKSNILLGYSEDKENLEKLDSFLMNSGVFRTLQEFPEGLETAVGENGSKLSGGQRQKIGIARALLSNPSIIIMDEATSAMDSQSEFEIIETLEKYRKSKTLIVIAHRLSTIRNADRILYIDQGKVLADGKFDWIRKQVSDFDEQARLMGL